MEELLAVETKRRPLGIDHIRLLKLVRKGAGASVKLPLRFKHERQIIDRLVADGLVSKGDSGWPGVPGYSITQAGAEAIGDWLERQREPHM